MRAVVGETRFALNFQLSASALLHPCGSLSPLSVIVFFLTSHRATIALTKPPDVV